MTRQQLIHEIYRKKSVLCVGLDTDISKLPNHISPDTDGVLEFNTEIIKHTQDYAVAYKINTAFYEAMGSIGWDVMQKTLDLIPDNMFTIADAKRGDIGNTAEQYKKAFFDQMDFDSITLTPYMGLDSIQPFMSGNDKWGIVLGLTSNIGNRDLQKQKMEDGRTVSEYMMSLLAENFNDEQLMFVVGATNKEELIKLRTLYPSYFFLVPGVGTQGGSLNDVMTMAWIPEDAGLLINVSRDILYQSSDNDYAIKSKWRAESYQKLMAQYFE